MHTIRPYRIRATTTTLHVHKLTEVYSVPCMNILALDVILTNFLCCCRRLCRYVVIAFAFRLSTSYRFDTVACMWESRICMRCFCIEPGWAKLSRLVFVQLLSLDANLSFGTFLGDLHNILYYAYLLQNFAIVPSVDHIFLPIVE